MELLGIYLLLACIPAYVASQKGRSTLGYFLLAIVISPLLALIIVAVVPVVAKPAPPVWSAGDLEALSHTPGPGMRCGSCGKDLGETWRGMCYRCGTSFSRSAPVPKT